MKTLICFASVLMLASTGAYAQLSEQPPCDDPIDVGGEMLEVIDNIATLTGDVRVVQCGSVLSTTKLIGTQDASGDYESLRAIGEVRYSNGKEAIRGDDALYDLVARTITFTNNVVVTQGEQVMTGGSLIYWIDTGRIRFSAPTGKRVRGIFHTKTLDTQL